MAYTETSTNAERSYTLWWIAAAIVALVIIAYIAYAQNFIGTNYDEMSPAAGNTISQQPTDNLYDNTTNDNVPATDNTME